MKQFSIKIPNRPGELARLAGLLAESKINIRSIASERYPEGGGTMTVITNDDAKTSKALNRAGMEFISDDVLTVSLPDKPGQLARTAKQIADAGINIDQIYVIGKTRGKTEIVFLARDIAGVKRALGKK